MSLRSMDGNSNKFPKRDYRSGLLNGLSTFISISLPSVFNIVAQVILSLFSKPKLQSAWHHNQKYWGQL